MLAEEFQPVRLKTPDQSDVDNTPKESEDLIWERFKAGSQSALTYIYRSYSKLLFNYGCQFTDDRDLVKDTLQDLFIELINRRERLTSVNSIKFYLLKSFRNKLVKTIQKNQRRTNSEQDSIHGTFLISVSAETRMINGQLDEEKQRILEESLNQLPPLQREALILYFYEGLKYQEIADMLGIKVKSSRALVYRATESLGDILAPYKETMLPVLSILVVMKNSL